MKKILLIVFAFYSLALIAQKSNPWKIQNDKALSSLRKVNRSSIPKAFVIFDLDLNVLKSQLAAAPMRGQNRQSTTEITLPNSDGLLERYRVVETPIMEAELAARYPMIKSYAAQGISDPTAVARFTITSLGFHSMVLSSGKSTVFIDPYTDDRQHYIVYQKSDLERTVTDFTCLTDDNIELPSLSLDRNANAQLDADDSLLRTYRLAQSCTAEYGNIFAGTGTIAQQKANIQSQMAITMTRVNGVYEIDLGVTMIFVANNDAIIYLGSITADPWSNEWNTKTAQTIDAAIGVANYDIGHNFNTTGGGNAGCIACVCKSVSQSGTHKGRGYTGSTNPTGDAFDIDYVAHEMGHQFGGYHTQSSSGCRSGSGFTEVEPGSASTIMGYAGICPSNVQSNSDPYFAYVNLRDISAYIKSAAGSCSVNTSMSNEAPVVEAGANYTIPKSTAFILTATGSDPDGDTLTYTWEENDPENPNTTAAPVPTRVAGPMFRSITGTTSPSRYFPALATVLTGATANTWEVVPSVARTMDFSVVARDNVAGGGQTASDLMTVTVNGTAGPFVVNSPNTAISWTAGSNQTVTWNEAGTTANGVNCEFIDIYLSTNSGSSFPTLLASEVPNDGSEMVTIPASTGTQHRIMVRGNNHIFYDVSNTNFTVAATSPTFSLAFDGTTDGQNKSVCQGEDAVFNVNYETIGGFSSITTLSLSGNPTGTTTSFNSATISSTGQVILTVATTGAATPGVYPLTVTGTSGATTKSVNLYLVILNSSFNVPTLNNPAHEAYAQNTAVTLQWNSDPAATFYTIEVATDLDFTNVITNADSPSNSYALTGLSENTNYFWRVLPKNDGCQGIYSAISQFTTGEAACANFSSTNVPVSISGSGTPTVNSTLTIPAPSNVVIADIDVTLNITHTWISDLTVTLISPLGTQIQLFAGQCGDDDNANATFDDSGSALTCLGNPTTISGIRIPAEALSGLAGENSAGTWTLRALDSEVGDGGAINSWSLNICSIPNVPVSCGEITTIWNGSTWSNGFPTYNVSAVVNGNLTLTRDLDACSIDINNTSAVTLTSGFDMTIENAVSIAAGASLTVQNNANLIQVSNVSNTGSATIIRESNPLMRLDYTIWSSPVTGIQTLKQFSPLTLNNRFYNYNSQTNLYNTVPDPVTTTFGNGEGYLIRMPDNHPTTPTIWTGTFTGTPNNGDFTVNLDYFGAAQGFNMVGNPYPSTIDAELFLSANASDINGTLYFWRKTNNAAGTAYATYTLGGSTTTSPTSPVPNGVIQAGQGFFVEAKNVATPQVAFTNALRIGNNANQIFRSNDLLANSTQVTERHRIWLNLTNDAGLFSQMLVGYMENATLGYDEMIDGKYIGDSPISLTSISGNEDLSIQFRPVPFDSADVVPLGFRTDVAGNYTIAISSTDGLFADGQDIFLIDNLLNTWSHLNEASYNFLSDAGEFDTRFEIVFESPTLGNPDFNIADDVQIITGNNQITVKSSQEMMTGIAVYDILGRILYQNQNLSSQLFSIPGLTPSSQTLLVKIKLYNGGEEIKKISF